jgi:hypothetical protein
MFDRVIAFPNGTVVFFLKGKILIYSKDGRVTEKINYKKEDRYDYMDMVTDLYADSRSSRRY